VAQSEETRRRRVRAHYNRRLVLASALAWFHAKAPECQSEREHALRWWEGCAKHELALAFACAALVLHPESPPVK
jgi:hypothetical protein